MKLSWVGGGKGSVYQLLYMVGAAKDADLQFKRDLLVAMRTQGRGQIAMAHPYDHIAEALHQTGIRWDNETHRNQGMAFLSEYFLVSRTRFDAHLSQQVLDAFGGLKGILLRFPHDPTLLPRILKIRDGLTDLFPVEIDPASRLMEGWTGEIGRASCRERV